MEKEIFKDLYKVLVDGETVGFTSDKDEIWHIAEKSLYGIDTLYDDDVDRVDYHYIITTKYYSHRNDIYNMMGQHIFSCKNENNSKEAVKILNALNLKKERAEAKLRAMTL